MWKRIAAISLIFFCATLAWMILGATIFTRTYDRSPVLRQKVLTSWGGTHEQRPPTACYYTPEAKVTEVVVDGKTERRTTRHRVSHPLPLERSRLEGALRLEHRQKGLLWYSTYGVTLAARHSFRNPTAESREVTFYFQLPSEHAIYDDLLVALDGQPVSTTTKEGKIEASALVAGNATVELAVSYRSQGLDSWSYTFGEKIAGVRDFEMRVSTNFTAVDFPEGSLSPTSKRPLNGGWELIWSYRSLMTGQHIAITMPEKLQPGPLAGRISFFAPVSLLFFFFVMFILTTLKRVDLHPMNYFFLAAAFFAFHLLLAYLVDQLPLHASFAIASVVSVFLVVSYLRLVTGWRFAALEAGIGQLVYLVLFSYAFFFQGLTGLTITVGAIITLFVTMQLTGRIRWGA